jgi:3-deoxy-D-manno-octulosonic acid kinase
MEGGGGDCLLRLSRAGALIRRIHELGVYHTDLHVKNILLDRDMNPWIIDLDNAYRFEILPDFMRKTNLRRFIRSLVNGMLKAG